MAMQGVLIEYSTMKYANNQFNAVNVSKTEKMNNAIWTFFHSNQNITLPLATVRFKLMQGSLSFFSKILLAV